MTIENTRSPLNFRVHETNNIIEIVLPVPEPLQFRSQSDSERLVDLVLKFGSRQGTLKINYTHDLSRIMYQVLFNKMLSTE